MSCNFPGRSRRKRTATGSVDTVSDEFVQVIGENRDRESIRLTRGGITPLNVDTVTDVYILVASVRVLVAVLTVEVPGVTLTRDDLGELISSAIEVKTAAAGTPVHYVELTNDDTRA